MFNVKLKYKESDDRYYVEVTSDCFKQVYCSQIGWKVASEALEKGEALIDALINAGILVVPNIGLKEEA